MIEYSLEITTQEKQHPEMSRMEHGFQTRTLTHYFTPKQCIQKKLSDIFREQCPAPKRSKSEPTIDRQGLVAAAEALREESTSPGVREASLQAFLIHCNLFFLTWLFKNCASHFDQFILLINNNSGWQLNLRIYRQRSCKLSPRELVTGPWVPLTIPSQAGLTIPF